MKRFGIWLWPQDVLAQGAEAVMAQCDRIGVTDVFLLTKGLAGKVCYHRTMLAPPVLYPECDILDECLTAAHKRNIRLHAWFTSANDAAYRQGHPEAASVYFNHRENPSIIRMGDAGYGAYMESLISELFATYAVDGLHLDYIRYNHISNGWAQADQKALGMRGADVAHLQRLMRETFYDDASDGVRIFDAYRANDPDVLVLSQYRRDTVVSFAARLIAAARKSRPGLMVSAALMPEGAYSDLAFSDLHYGQNYYDAAELYDFVLPMAYHVEYKQTPVWVADIAKSSILRGNRVLVGIQAYGEATMEAATAGIEAIRTAEDPMLEGVCLFRYGEAACDGLMRANSTGWNLRA